MKSYMPQIAANERLRKHICENILADKLSHAYIIEGAPGTGRHLLARSIAMSLACLHKDLDGFSLPCNSCEQCRKVANNLSPDVILLSREEGRSTIGVDIARFIKSDIQVVPNDLDYKIYIIEEADRMTEEAQNALLLTLEEPPKYAEIILICEKADSLLETVRSRAPVLRTELVAQDIMERYLCESAPSDLSSEACHLKESSPKDFYEVITASNGSIGRAQELLKRDTRNAVLKSRESIKAFIKTALNSCGASALTDSASIFSQKRDEFSEQLNTVMIALRDLLVLKKSETAPLCFYSDREEALELSSTRSANYLLKFMAACEEAISSLRHNANVKLTSAILIASI